MKATPLLLAAACAITSAALLSCGDSGTEMPAGLNPGPPIRGAFRLTLDATAQEIRAYARENGHVPLGEGGQALLAAGIRSAPVADPWGNPVRYSGEGMRFTLASAGPDQQWDTKDDLSVTDGE